MTTTNPTKKQKEGKYAGSLGDYKILHKLEGGSQATILIGEDKTHKEVIIKIFRQQKIFLREAKYLTQAGDHPNLIKVLDILKEAKIKTKKNGREKIQTVNAIVFEKGKVDLFLLISKCENFSEPTCRYFFKKLLSCLSHCHEKNVAHCDLKLENIIFDRFGKIKLIDFGLAHKI